MGLMKWNEGKGINRLSVFSNRPVSFKRQLEADGGWWSDATSNNSKGRKNWKEGKVRQRELKGNKCVPVVDSAHIHFFSYANGFPSLGSDSYLKEAQQCHFEVGAAVEMQREWKFYFLFVWKTSFGITETWRRHLQQELFLPFLKATGKETIGEVKVPSSSISLP